MTDQKAKDPVSLPQPDEALQQPLSRLAFLVTIALLLSVIAVCIAAWQWQQNRQRFMQLEYVLTERLEKFSDNNQRSLNLAKQADERSIEAVARTSLFEQKLAESQDKQEAVEAIYRALSNSREERLVSEVEQLLNIANQQLLLAGNVKPALLAMQTADARLQQLATSQAVQLRKVLGRDIQLLQSLPLIDVVGMSLRLENLSASIDSLPLVSERHPASKQQTAPDWDSNPWRRLARETWQDLKRLIRVERIDRAEPPLLAPDQSFFLRENIKLRLLAARVALLQHDESSYRNDLMTAEKWISAYFDLREPATRSSLASIQALSSSDIVIELPDIGESLGLASKYKLSLETSSSQSLNR